jgi:fused signal recognition particle receptor
MKTLLLVLIVLTLLFGLSVPLISRMRAGRRTVDLEPPVRPKLDPRPDPQADTVPTPTVKAPRPIDKPAPAKPPVKEQKAAPPPVAVPVDEPLVDDEELERQALEAAPEVEVEEVEPEEIEERPRFRDRLGRARSVFKSAVGIRGSAGITQTTWDDLEESLLLSDLGVHRVDELLADLKGRVKSEKIKTPDALLDALKADLKGRLEGGDRSLHLVPGEPGSPNVWLFVGVNGVGKTTTIGKVGAQQVREGRSVVMAAGDTFRAAAAEQLGTWASRGGAELVRGAEGGDPSSVIFDGIKRAAAKNADLVLADTAGRLHTKSNLMEELAKVRRVAGREPGRVTEVLLVIDATTGQNGLIQAREFTEATDVTGVVLTKLDGSAKGGIVFAIETELGIPVKLVGLGEGINDLVPFDPEEFIDALFEA